MPAWLYACAHACAQACCVQCHAGIPSPWHPKLPKRTLCSVSSRVTPQKRDGCIDSIGLHATRAFRRRKILKHKPEICLEKHNSPCCCVPGLWGPEIRFCGCVKRSQNIWRRIRQAPLHSCLHPEKTCPPFPCTIDVRAHTKDLRKYKS